MSENRIEIVSVYRVKGDQKKYRTYKAAVNRLAWKIVFEKYGDDLTEYSPFEFRNDMKNPHPFGEKCDCHKPRNRRSDEPPYHKCPIHDRRHGYIRKIHDKLVSYILLKYPSSRIAGENA
ncbi:MAG: hypothetical protein GY755_10630 [Chloroflexi bacterium]|nr:hypothetical protein [Chloroflexota bacterium]